MEKVGIVKDKKLDFRGLFRMFTGKSNETNKPEDVIKSAEGMSEKDIEVLLNSMNKLSAIEQIAVEQIREEKTSRQGRKRPVERVKAGTINLQNIQKDKQIDIEKEIGE